MSPVPLLSCQLCHAGWKCPKGEAVPGSGQERGFAAPISAKPGKQNGRRAERSLQAPALGEPLPCSGIAASRPGSAPPATSAVLADLGRTLVLA